MPGPTNNAPLELALLGPNAAWLLCALETRRPVRHAWGDHAEAVRGLFATAGRLAGVVLTLDAERGVTPALRDEAWAAFRLGVPRVAAMLSLPPGASGVAADACELDLRRVLHEQGYPGDDALVMRSDAPGRPLAEFAAHIDGWPDGAPDDERPLRFEVESAECLKRGRYALCRGRVEQGRVAVGDRVDVLGPTGTAACVPVLGVRGFHRERPHGAASGERVGVLLRGALLGCVGPGAVLAKAGSGAATAARSFDALLHFHPNGPRSYFASGLAAVLTAPLRDAEVRVTWGGTAGWARAGDCVAATVHVLSPAALAVHRGLCFALGGRYGEDAAGVVVA